MRESSITIPEKLQRVEIDRSKIFSLSPRELAEYFRTIEENDQFEAFCRQIVADDALFATVSWWERWLTQKQIRAFETAVAERRRYKSDEAMADLPLALERKFSNEEMKSIFENLGALQLTFGCSVGCKFCAFDALPRAREHLPFKQVRHVLERYGNILPKVSGHVGHRTLYYYASDPGDYESRDDDNTRTFRDVHDLVMKYTGHAPFVSTRRINNSRWMEYVKGLKQDEKRVSTLGLSVDRAKVIREEFGGKFSHSEPKRGMGRDFGHSASGPEWGGIGCFDGTTITPRGLYNTVQVPVSERYPQGLIVAPIERLSGVTVAVGDRLDQALRYVVARNIPINDLKFYNKESERIHASGNAEFCVILNGREKYLIIDRNFVIREIRDDSPSQRHLAMLTEKLKSMIEAAERSPKILGDENFAEEFWKFHNHLGRIQVGGRYHLSFPLLNDQWLDRFNKVIKAVADKIREIQEREKSI